MISALGFSRPCDGIDMKNAANVTPAEAITNAAFVIADLHGDQALTIGAEGVMTLVRLFAESLVGMVNLPKEQANAIAKVAIFGALAKRTGNSAAFAAWAKKAVV
jgi:hypothetical protein